TYSAKASFVPASGSASAIDHTTITIDTRAPALATGAASVQGPLYTRTLVFSKAPDAATIGAAAVSIAGPGLASHPSQVTGAGTTYTVTFAAPLTQGGTYTIQLSAGVADPAGNAI